eukprot:106873_1
MSFSTFKLAFGICYCILCWCLLAPLLFYYTYQFYLLRKTPIIFKRHYRIVIVINLVISIYIIFSRPFLIISTLTGSTTDDNCLKSTTNCSIWQTISDVSDSISSHGWTSLLVVRTWFIYFETTYNKHYSKGQWTQFINPKTIETQINKWQFRFRNTLGKE